MFNQIDGHSGYLNKTCWLVICFPICHCKTLDTAPSTATIKLTVENLIWRGIIR